MNDTTRQKISEHRKEYDEFPYQWQCERRIEFLGDQMEDRIIDAYRLKLMIEEDILRNRPPVQILYTQGLYKQAATDILKLQANIVGLRESYQKNDGSKDRITEDMILRARSFPVEQLHEFNSRGWGICPFHEDKRPSLHIHNNRIKCWSGSCAFEGDTIDFLMKKEGITFQAAVRRLQ
jgi:hypothetical protein